MRDVVIVSAARTAIGKFGGSFLKTSAVELGTAVIKEAIHRAKISPEDVEYVVMGNVIQTGLGQNPARQASVFSGIPYSTPAMTINEMCGSGMKSIHLGMQSIMLGEKDVVVVGGFENMSQAPHIIKNGRFGSKFQNLETEDTIQKDGFVDAFTNELMGVTAETVAEQFHISREDQDAFALESQMRATRALEAGLFKDEIVPVNNGRELIDTDEFIRTNSTLEGLQRLKPSFKLDGTVTAGNASGVNDGAAALILMSREKAEAMDLEIIATIKGFSEVGVEPEIMGYAPYYAVKSLVEKTNTDLNTVDRFELNEAFASQSLAVCRDLNLDLDKVNVNGGAISIGHPIGASGARIMVTLIYELIHSNTKRGIASLCIGGGMGVAMMIEREEPTK
ncbi:acetyl-CoA C-acetyltransferase [Erysipelothrix sp. strain 2 (EsS2-7-Brazil)]|uniref:acetyl-CoA C-acetyltransferase n=1 Tax=Erysipelothrix sp. strain 2 (EsS2-7-Brazil) TaxID=2500579 RepID=UPI00190DBB39|nr:acetyl-CoA C-acetyltransferase [Erysipelothrix sp. strain 2 (EsS2-7-Brazil)]MBK2404576.1 acetyl-CoA C-acetyltransferase [Erysipelothrix sp. strain 2 (EsS2-7-Brazil)]